jgi:succinate-acetate transporter protein
MSTTQERLLPPRSHDQVWAPASGGDDDELRAVTRIVLRPMGSPMPLGFFTVAVASVMVSALQVGILDAVDQKAVALVILPAFVLQLFVGVFALWARDGIAATLMFSLATTWLIEALIFYLRPAGGPGVLGIFLVVFSVFFLLLFVSALPKVALAAVLAVAVPRFFLSCIADITGSKSVAHAAGVLGFLLAAVAIYTAFALLLEDSRGRPILPIGRHGPARSATQGNLTYQLKDIERQAGVRRTL